MPQLIIILLMLVGFMLAKCEKTADKFPKSGATNYSQKENNFRIAKKDSLLDKDSTKQAVM